MTEFLASLKLFAELLKQMQALWAFYKANQKEKWFQDSIQTFNELTKPNATLEEKKKAISDLGKLWAGV